jgi:hypothetical protein
MPAGWPTSGRGLYQVLSTEKVLKQKKKRIDRKIREKPL